jgi:quercetin dioxygenase-like cupin family protein
MALRHAAPGEKIELRRSADDIAQLTSVALIKTAHMELIRLLVPKDKPMPEHWVEGEVTILCLEGEIVIEMTGRETVLRPNEMLYLMGAQPHGIRANEDAVALLTILLGPGENTGGPVRSSTVAA